MLKRLFDIFVSLLFMPLLLPIMMCVAILIKMDSTGPIVFKQQRVGLNGVGFSSFKFRSMLIDASGLGPHFTRTGDPRITRIGRVIRKTSLDELPQLFNVLKGDMSLVGPRPNVLAQRKEYAEDEWNKRNSVRPGITGLAQALLRSAATPEQRTSLDLEYVDKSSLLYDIGILFMTVKQVFFRGGN